MVSFPMARRTIPFRIGSKIPLLSAAAVVTALADWLFYRHQPGISVAIFLTALCATVLVTNPVRASRTEFAVAIAVLAAALVPAIEDFGLLSLVFAVAGASIFALLATGWPARPAVQRLTDVGWMIVSGPFRLGADLCSAIREAGQRDIAKHGSVWLMAWIVPVGLGGLFLLLFSQANPLIEKWLTSADISYWNNLDWVRPMFWFAVIALTWQFLQVRIGNTLEAIKNALTVSPVQSPPGQSQAATTSPVATVSAAGPLFGKTAILRSLVLFNGLFAVQSALDAAYLWGGLALPAGMSYASYAHRGAYPLILTALLAAAFVLAAMQPGSSIERSRLARALVFLWIGQNVLLVFSSMLRLNLYVDAYSLTEWRCAAFVWMLLVAAGLVLIVTRIVFNRSNRWLVWSNAAVLALTLYICSLVDFSGLIARFNVMHSREITGVGAPVDMAYLCSLGPAALPALNMLAANANATAQRPPVGIAVCRRSLELRHAGRMGDWRAWTFRGYRLQQFLDESDARALAAGVHQSMM
ncbi:MAG: DUF4173 domain-containing protein [Xanthobacteraceae bacterium]|nr:DUF4173 domain-containing protein [Xanthobacteraceae bacterium]